MAAYSDKFRSMPENRLEGDCGISNLKDNAFIENTMTIIRMFVENGRITQDAFHSALFSAGGEHLFIYPENPLKKPWGAALGKLVPKTGVVDKMWKTIE